MATHEQATISNNINYLLRKIQHMNAEIAELKERKEKLTKVADGENKFLQMIK